MNADGGNEPNTADILIHLTGNNMFEYKNMFKYGLMYLPTTPFFHSFVSSEV